MSQQEFIVRVPRQTKKKNFNVMRFSAALNVDASKWNCAKLKRENNFKDFKAEEGYEPKFGAGSEFGREAREEARKKKYSSHSRKYNPDSQPWLLKLGSGKNSRKFKGNREGGINTNTSYYVFFQAHDGAFEAYPVNEWYNFTPIQRYKALTAEEAEEKFEKRDKILNFFSIMYSKKKQGNEGGESVDVKIKTEKKGRDFKVSDMDEWGNLSNDSENDSDGNKSDEKASKSKAKAKVKGKGKKKGKAKKGSDEDDDSEPLEESDEGDFDTREVDYISDSSSSAEEVETEKRDQMKGVEDEDALRQLFMSDDENEEENKEEGESAEKPAEEVVKKPVDVKPKPEKVEYSESSASSAESDSDFDDTKFQSAMFMQAKAKKNKGGSDNSNSNSRADTPTGTDASGSVDDKRDVKGSLKRKFESNGDSLGKKQKMSDASGSQDGITDEAVRRYLMRKPMTTTELLQKFKSKKIEGMSSAELVTGIAQILKRLNPEKQTIKGKLYLSIRPS